MINEEKTLEQFGYTSDSLSYGSRKRIVAICNGCGKERIVRNRSYRDLCISCCQIGKIHSGMLGKKISEETKQKMSKLHLNKKHSEQTKKKISKSISGKNHPNWQGGISFKPYCVNFNNKIKELIRKEFNRKCFLCGVLEKEHNKKLSIHHIDYDKNQGCNRDWKLIPLCNSCHSKTSGKYMRDYYEVFISRLLYIRELILEYDSKIDYRSIGI